MKQFNPMQYLAIDIANHFGLDKLNYEDRIDWVKTNIDDLEQFTSTADEPLLYAKAVHAFRQVQQGLPVGHAVAFDAACSGLQIMSVLMRCKSGCYLTGLIDPNKRIDAYSMITDAMNEELSKQGKQVSVSRKDAKKAIMTSLYGSLKVPEDIFGEDVLPIYYSTLQKYCSGAMELLEMLRDSWNANSNVHEWTLPDGHTAYVPVVDTVEKRITVSEGAFEYSPTMRYKEQTTKQSAVSNIANVVHSIDGYILRTIYRKCNYHKGIVKSFLRLDYDPTKIVITDDWINDKYKATGIADISFINHIDQTNIHHYPTDLIHSLIVQCKQMLEHEPFEVICIHDSFACHANYMDYLRRYYNQILAELSESTVIDDILSQLYGIKGYINTKGESLKHDILNSNYGLT